VIYFYFSYIFFIFYLEEGNKTGNFAMSKQQNVAKTKKTKKS